MHRHYQGHIFLFRVFKACNNAWGVLLKGTTAHLTSRCAQEHSAVGVGSFTTDFFFFFCLTGELSQHSRHFRPCSRWRFVANQSSATSGSSEFYAQPKWHNILAPGQSSLTNNRSSDRRNLNERSHNILTAFLKENDWLLYEYHLFNNACLQYFYICDVPTTITNFDVFNGHYQHSHTMKNS